MSGRPGDGCTDPRDGHFHWCGFCGVEIAFAAVQCSHLRIVPPCPRCGGTDWRNEIDQLTREGLSYPAEPAIYEMEVAEFLAAMPMSDRMVVENALAAMSAKDQWELIQSFFVED